MLTHTHTHKSQQIFGLKSAKAFGSCHSPLSHSHRNKSSRDELQDVVVKARCAPLFAVVCVSCGSSEVKENGKLQKASKLFGKKVY